MSRAHANLERLEVKTRAFLGATPCGIVTDRCNVAYDHFNSLVESRNLEIEFLAFVHILEVIFAEMENGPRIVQVRDSDNRHTGTNDFTFFGKAKVEKEVKAKRSGYISFMNTEEIGRASLLLGAGRNTMADVIDMTAGIKLLKKTGDYVEEGETIALFYTGNRSRLYAAETAYEEALTFSDEKPVLPPLIRGTVE